MYVDNLKVINLPTTLETSNRIGNSNQNPEAVNEIDFELHESQKSEKFQEIQ